MKISIQVEQILNDQRNLETGKGSIFVDGGSISEHSEKKDLKKPTLPLLNFTHLNRSRACSSETSPIEPQREFKNSYYKNETAKNQFDIRDKNQS